MSNPERINTINNHLIIINLRNDNKRKVFIKIMYIDVCIICDSLLFLPLRLTFGMFFLAVTNLVAFLLTKSDAK